MIQKRRTVKIRSPKRNKINFSRWIYWVLFLAFWGVIFYIVFFSGKLAVVNISISGEKEIEADLIMGKVNPEIEGRYLGIVDKSNLLLVRSGKIEDDLKKEFKKIENISVKKKFPGTIIVDILERQTPIILLSADKNFLIDENGMAYDDVASDDSQFSNVDSLILRDNSATEVDFSESVLDKAYISYLTGLRDQLRGELNLEIDRRCETPSLVSGDIRVLTVEGWRIYFNTDISLKKELEMLAVSLDNKIEKTKRTELEYVDLRSDNKVFYKFKNSSEEGKEENSSDATKEIVPEVKGVSKAKKAKK